ncbi:MAG: hypothetical protein MHM6MM_001769 [Cercozoa sp. M6MM]
MHTSLLNEKYIEIEDKETGEIHVRQIDWDDPDNPDNKFTRSEFLEALIRLCLIKYEHLDITPEAKLAKLMEEHVIHGMEVHPKHGKMMADSTKEQLTMEDAQNFVYYTLLDRSTKRTPLATISWKDYTVLLRDKQILSNQFSHRRAMMPFGMSQDPSDPDMESAGELEWREFIECK